MADGKLDFAPARAIQRDQIERLLRAAFAPYVRKLGRAQTDDAYAWLDASIDRGDVFVGMRDGEIVGVVATRRHAAGLTIDQVAVDPALQGGGLGGLLLDSVERVARDAGVEALTLDTAAMMSDLLRLYHRHGFEEVRRGPPAHGKDAHLRVHLRKAL